MRQWAIRTTQRALGRFGVRLVRWPTSLAETGEANSERFFPVGPVKPWTVPGDLRERTDAWARVLVGVYDDPASWPSSIAPEAGMLLQSLVRNIQPRVIVETGTCLGASTIWMASGLRALWGAGESGRRSGVDVDGGGPALHTFDLYLPPPDERLASSGMFHNRRQGVERRIAEAGLADLVHIHQGDSASTITSMHERLRAAGGVHLAYIDGDHSPRGAAADFQAVEAVLPVGGYVILHDTFPAVCNHLGPRWLIDHIHEVSKGAYQVCELYTAQTNYGLGVLRRVR